MERKEFSLMECERRVRKRAKLYGGGAPEDCCERRRVIVWGVEHPRHPLEVGRIHMVEWEGQVGVCILSCASSQV